MKKQFAAVLLLLSLGLAACSDTTPPDTDATDSTTPAESTDPADSITPNDTAEEGFSLTVGDAVLTPGAVVDVTAILGEPLDQQTAPSCVHEGDDIVYYYDGLEIATSPSPAGQYITSITLTSDVYTTAEGVYIGSTAAEMTAAYGETEAQFGRYVYTKGSTTLTFMTDDAGTITAIAYAFAE